MFLRTHRTGYSIDWGTNSSRHEKRDEREESASSSEQSLFGGQKSHERSRTEESIRAPDPPTSSRG